MFDTATTTTQQTQLIARMRELTHQIALAEETGTEPPPGAAAMVALLWSELEQTNPDPAHLVLVAALLRKTTAQARRLGLAGLVPA